MLSIGSGVELNDDSIIYICSFLSQKDRWTLIRKMGSAWLVNMTQKAKVLFSLSEESSLRFYQDELFRQRVKSMVGRDSNWRELISLELRNSRDVTNVRALREVHTLKLRGLNIQDVSALGTVHTLDLGCCGNITDVSALGGVHELNLSNCSGITDIFALGSVHTLNLSNCRGIIAFSYSNCIQYSSLYFQVSQMYPRWEESIY